MNYLYSLMNIVAIISQSSAHQPSATASTAEVSPSVGALRDRGASESGADSSGDSNIARWGWNDQFPMVNWGWLGLG